MKHDGSSGIGDHKAVSHEEWLSARTAFLAKEKEFTRLRDELSRRAARAAVGEGREVVRLRRAAGKETLAELFGKRSQLVVYHFMFGPDWKEGCPHCSFWADNFNGIGVHLDHAT